MRQLDAGHRALRFDERGDAPQRFDLLVAPDAQVVGGNPPVRLHGGGFEDDQPGPAHGPTAQVHQVPVVGQAVHGRVLAHGRYGDAIGQGQLAQGQRLEK